MIKIKKGHLKIQITELPSYGRNTIIIPKGFWSKMVGVHQSKKLSGSEWEEPEISWSTGGQDDSVSNKKLVIYFIEALNEALLIQGRWKREMKNKKGE